MGKMQTTNFIEHQHINIYVTYFLLFFTHFIINDYPVVLLLVYRILLESDQCCIQWLISRLKNINVPF